MKKTKTKNPTELSACPGAKTGSWFRLSDSKALFLGPRYGLPASRRSYTQNDESSLSCCLRAGDQILENQTEQSHPNRLGPGYTEKWFLTFHGPSTLLSRNEICVCALKTPTPALTNTRRFSYNFMKYIVLPNKHLLGTQEFNRLETCDDQTPFRAARNNICKLVGTGIHKSPLKSQSSC